MKLLIMLCSAIAVLSGCVISPLYGVDGRDHARGHERRDRDESRYYLNRDRDSSDRHAEPYRN